MERISSFALAAQVVDGCKLGQTAKRLAIVDLPAPLPPAIQ
jgi:hypothetical protein